MSRRRDTLTDADIGYPAWRGFVQWALEQPEFREQFTMETGIVWPTEPRTFLDAAIDHATGHRERVADRFILWVTDRHYGLDEVPPAVREAIEKGREGRL